MHTTSFKIYGAIGKNLNNGKRQTIKIQRGRKNKDSPTMTVVKQFLSDDSHGFYKQKVLVNHKMSQRASFSV